MNYSSYKTHTFQFSIISSINIYYRFYRYFDILISYNIYYWFLSINRTYHIFCHKVENFERIEEIDLIIKKQSSDKYEFQTKCYVTE